MNLKFFTLAAALMLGTTPLAQAKSMEEIRACMLANLPSETSEQSVRMRSIDRAGSEQAFTARLFWRHRADRDSSLMARIDSPIDLEGSAYLATMEGDEQTIYSYIPSLRKVHRIRGNSSSGKLWGTDFSFEDIRYLQAIATSGELALEGESMLGDRKTWTITLVPDPVLESGYSRIENQVDQTTCVPLKTVFYQAQHEPTKLLEADPTRLAQEEGLWLARRITMRDELNQTRTEVEITRVRNDKTISPRTFSANQFYKAK